MKKADSEKPAKSKIQGGYFSTDAKLMQRLARSYEYTITSLVKMHNISHTNTATLYKVRRNRNSDYFDLLPQKETELPHYLQEHQYVVAFQNKASGAFLSVTTQTLPFKERPLSDVFSSEFEHIKAYRCAYSLDVKEQHTHWIITQSSDNEIYTIKMAADPSWLLTNIVYNDQPDKRPLSQHICVTVPESLDRHRPGKKQQAYIDIRLVEVVKNQKTYFQLIYIDSNEQIVGVIGGGPIKQGNQPPEDKTLWTVVVVPGPQAAFEVRKAGDVWKTLYTMNNASFINRQVFIEAHQGFSIIPAQEDKYRANQEEALWPPCSKFTLGALKQATEHKAEVDLLFLGKSLRLSWSVGTGENPACSFDNSVVDGDEVKLEDETVLPRELITFVDKTTTKESQETTTIELEFRENMKSFKFQQKFTLIKRYLPTKIFGDVLVDKIALAHPEFRSIDLVDDLTDLKNELEQLQKEVKALPVITGLREKINGKNKLVNTPASQVKKKLGKKQEYYLKIYVNQSIKVLYCASNGQALLDYIQVYIMPRLLQLKQQARKMKRKIEVFEANKNPGVLACEKVQQIIAEDIGRKERVLQVYTKLTIENPEQAILYTIAHTAPFATTLWITKNLENFIEAVISRQDVTFIKNLGAKVHQSFVEFSVKVKDVLKDFIIQKKLSITIDQKGQETEALERTGVTINKTEVVYEIDKISYRKNKL